MASGGRDEGGGGRLAGRRSRRDAKASAVQLQVPESIVSYGADGGTTSVLERSSGHDQPRATTLHREPHTSTSPLTATASATADLWRVSHTVCYSYFYMNDKLFIPSGTCAST